MASFPFTSFPYLETERLSLGPLLETDEKEIFLLRSDASVNEFLDRPRASTLKEAGDFIQKIQKGVRNHESLFWAIRLKTEPALIGTICLWNPSPKEKRAEIGYELLPQHQRRGYMQEALNCVIRYGFGAAQLKTIEAWLRAKNLKSIKILENSNFKRDLHAEARMSPDEKQQGMIVYSLTNGSPTNPPRHE